MPCDSVTTQSVVLTKAMPDLVAEAMKALGWVIRQQTKTSIQGYTGRVLVTWVVGQGLTASGYGGAPQEQITALTKAYSVQGVIWAANRAGWQVQQTAPDKLLVSRR